MTSTEGVAMQVDDVYVPLGLVKRKKLSKRQGDVSPEQGSELYKETEITKTFEHDAFLEEVLKQQNTPKSQSRRIAIIGEPGAGKTTLLQQIANWVYRKIPQSIVIWVSLADLQEQKLEEYLLGTWLTAAVRKNGKSEPTQQQKDDLIALFNQKNVWLLLDGLDEMSAASGNPLTEISRQFRESGFIYQARILLTCRVNLWDNGINELDNFDIYRTLDFSYPQQVDKFIHNWFAAIPETGKQLCSALKEPGKERIQDLVKNPLRLTLLCFNWQLGDGKLPDTQAGLYKRFVDDFYKWKQDKFPTTYQQKQQLNVKLGKLAKTAIDKETTSFRLPQDFVNTVFNQEEDEVLLELALNRGWLNCIGVDKQKVYAFFHASFQEYFAATAIDDWYFFLKHVPKNPSQGTYRIFEPQWKQTILLWLGREEENLKQQKQQFISALVNFKDGCGEWNREDVNKGFYEYRAYFLAAAGIAEFRGCYRANEIVSQIIRWGFGYFNTKKQKWIGFLVPDPIRAEARSALQQTDRTKAIAALLQLLQSKNVDDYICEQVAKILGEIGTGNEFVIATLLQLLQSKNVNNNIRKEVAESLGKIGIGNEKVIATLVQLLQSNHLDDDTRGWAVYSLVQIDPGNEIAIAILVQLLQSKNVAVFTYSIAVHSLGQIDSGNEIAIAALVQLLQSKNVDNSIRSLAASSLGKIDPGNEIAIAALVQLLQSKNVDDDTRIRAASSLVQIDPGNEIAIAALVQQLQSKYGGLFISMQLFSLMKIGTGNKKAIAALVQLLQSKNVDDDTRRRAAFGLGEIGIGNEIAINALVELLQSKNVEKYTRWQAASSLGKIGTGNIKAIQALWLLLLLKNVDDDTISQAAFSLGKILQDNKYFFEAIKTLSGYWQLYGNEYDLAWECAQNIPYPKFYQAWHQHNFSTRTMRSLKQIFFTKRI